MSALSDVIQRHKAGAAVGIYSVCSAHPLVLEAALSEARRTGGAALIEATSNQVNQDGGYTGMRPAAFRDLVHGLAKSVGLPTERVVLGGDHLGPNAWQKAAAPVAIEKAAVMVGEYVAEGFRKIHLDCSMSCAGDPRCLGDELIAERTATLCEVAETAWRRAGGEPPVYVIGSEVPVPGGANETLHDLAVTAPAAAYATIAAHRAAFVQRGLDDAWQRVVGLVVQPGVEFDHHRVIDYQRRGAAALSQSIAAVPGMVFEAHSTDYQTPAALKALVEDHFAILKVGPALSFALREVFWALADIAAELGLGPSESLKATLLGEMRRDPRYWQAYYLDPERQEFDLQFSLSDRIRYYWNAPAVRQACTALLSALAAANVPLTLISQYLPQQYAAIRSGRLKHAPHALLLDGVAHVLRDYAQACGPSTAQAGAALAEGRS